MNKILFVIFILTITLLPVNAEVLQDEIAAQLPKNVSKPEVYKNYDYTSVLKLPVNLRVLESIKSEDNIYEGQVIKFRVLKNVTYKNRVLIKRDSIVTARIRLVITPGMNGIPASIILSDFSSDEVCKGAFSGAYEIFGQDRSLWVYPLKWALTILPPTGSFTNLIKGGHAKIKTNKTITIYYYPEWI